MQSQRNSVPRRFGFGFVPTGSNSANTNNSNHNTSSSSSTTSNAVDTTPDSNRRHSVGKAVQSPIKGSPSPNRTSLKSTKGDPTTPSSVSSPVSKPATTSVQSPSSTTEISNSSVASVGGTSSASSTVTVEQSLIKVCVRVRPLLHEEVTESVVWQWKENSITPIPWHQRNQGGSNALEYSMANPNATFTFDHLFTPDHTNTHIFQDVIKDIVTSGMNGYHGSVFTYGQTSSGKTFTMYGAPSQQGVITQAIEYCFDAINTFPEREFLLRVSYLEVYNEQVKDLLSTEAIPIKILYDPKVGTVLSGVKEHVVFNPQQVYQLIKQGESHRHIGVTDMNAQSSRAHTLFKIIIESKERNSLKASPVRVSTLNLVDLAGSENAKMTNSTGERAREAKHINQSLLTLSTIIQRLSEEHAHHRKSSAQHLPYRDSKLTRLLESALDGNARIAIICNISPTSRCMEESVNTLKFGARAKLIRINAKVNENVDDKTLLRAYREEIEQLKLRLKELEEKQSVPAPVAAVPSTMMTPPLQRGRDRSQSHDDNQSIGVTSATKIDIHETIHQIEDKLMQTSHIAKEEDEHQKMLQMIEAMERLILKADNSSKQKLRRNLAASSAESAEPSERLIRSKSFKSGDNDQTEMKELESKRNLKKLPSFSTGIPINTSHRSNIPRRGANQNPAGSISRSASSVSIDNGSLPIDKVASGESDLFAISSKVFSPKGMEKKKSFNVSAQSSPRQPQQRQQSMFLSHSNSSRDIGDNGGVPMSSKSFEQVLLRSEGNEGQRTGENQDEEDEGEHKFSPLTRQPSIPLSDLQQNFNKLGANAEKVGLIPTVHLANHSHTTHAYSMPPPAPASDKDPPATTIDRTASISPLTVGTEPSASVLPQQATTRVQRLLPPLDTNVSNIGGFAFSPSTTVNHGTLPPYQPSSSAVPSSPYETHFLSASITGTTTPMKNRILRKVKYSEDNELVATPGVVGVASISGDTPLLDDNSASALEKMRQFAMSNDTLDSLNNSIDPRFVAPNDVLMEDDSVLLGVSKMLMMLKDYISKAKQPERPQAMISSENTSSKTSALIGIAAVSDNNSVGGKESVQTKTSEQSQASNSNNNTTNPTNNSNNNENKQSAVTSGPAVSNTNTNPTHRKRELGSHEVAVNRDEYDKLKQDLALKEADNHFLQEELEQKDKMLGMLTEGLKEVQESQLQWLTANQDLSQELEKTLLMNQILRNEITRLNNLLLAQQSQGAPTTSTEKEEEGGTSSQRKPSTATTFVSEEVTQLLLSPAMPSRVVSSNQNLYLSRSRSISQSRSPMRSQQSQGQLLSQISSPPTLHQSDVSTPFINREKTPPSSPIPEPEDIPTKKQVTNTPLVESLNSPSPVSPLPLTDHKEMQKEESDNKENRASISPLSAPVVMSPLQQIGASPPRSPKPSSIPSDVLMTPEPSNSVFVSPMSVSSTATTTIASPDSNAWTALNPSQVHIPSSANNVLDWKQLPMDFTNIHNEAELTEYFGANEDKEKKNGELQVENSVSTPLQTALGNQIISPGELSNMTNSHCSLDRDDASVIVHVERIYYSCDSMDSFGSIKESW